MIDFGLLLSAVLAIGVPEVLSQRWPLRSFSSQQGFMDSALGPAAVGIIVGRLAALMFDDPSALTRIAEVLIVRSGVEFWPGALAAAAAVAIGAPRGADGASPIAARLADLVPLSMIGYAAFEASCVFRSGCPGPAIGFGLTPSGTTTSVLPIGIAMALVVAAGAYGLHWWNEEASHRRQTGSASDWLPVLAGVLIVAMVRSVGSIWLPRIGDDLSRPHLTSVAVAGLAATSVAAAGLSQAWFRRRQ